MTVDNRDACFSAIVTTCGQRTVCKQDLPVKTPRTGEDASNVVGVFMRDQHSINIIADQAQSFQPAHHFARTKSGINQDASIPDFDQQSVSPATAAERSEAH